MQKSTKFKVLVAATGLLAMTALHTTAQAASDEAVNMVVSKMAEGDVSSICQGGRPTISAAAKEAVTELAQSGEVSGDYQAIGAAAGTKFYQSKC